MAHRTIDYTYDDLGQLTNESGSLNHDYTYDSHYSRLQKDEEAYSVDDLHRIHSTSLVDYEYDKNGNPIKKKYTSGKEVRYGYDALDRLIFLEETGKCKEEYEYDFFHRRIKKAPTYGKKTHIKNSSRNIISTMIKKR